MNIVLGIGEDVCIRKIGKNGLTEELGGVYVRRVCSRDNGGSCVKERVRVEIWVVILVEMLGWGRQSGEEGWSWEQR